MAGQLAVQDPMKASLHAICSFGINTEVPNASAKFNENPKNGASIMYV
jgi:hypothetical protein